MQPRSIVMALACPASPQNCHAKHTAPPERATSDADSGDGEDRLQTAPRAGSSSDVRPVPAVASSRYTAGDVIASKYEIVRLVGSGGMGAVWVAYHLNLDAEVAVKLMRADLTDESAAQRFLGEARLLARIDHRAVVRIFDFGYAENGDPFLVMEFLRGEDLRSVLSRRVRMPSPESVRLLLPVAEGLSAAHGREIVHRDLKPDNIFIAETGRGRQPKILDFGIARGVGARVDARVTGSGCVVGSPEYMAPEQAEGREDIDHRADVWGFCCVLYECVTGRRPYVFDGSYERLLRRIIDEPVAPISEHGVNDAALWKILSRGLAKDRDERWSSMDELGGALARWLIARGESDDACGTRLQTAWLPGGETPEAVSPTVPALRAPRRRAVAGRPTLKVAASLAFGFGTLSLIAALGGGGEGRADAAPSAVTRLKQIRYDLVGRHADGSPPRVTPARIETLPAALGSPPKAGARADAIARAGGRDGERPEASPRSSAATKPGAPAASSEGAGSATGARSVSSDDSVDLFYGDLGF